MPIQFKEGLFDKYKTYYTIANRMDYLERLLKLTEEGAPQEVIQCLLEVQDRYQLLSIWMEMHGKYEEKDIRTGMNPPFEVFYPSQDKVFSVEEAPDLYFEIWYCKFWGDKMEIPFSNPATLKLIGILSKALPSPCKSRSVTSILPDLWKDEDQKDGQVIYDCIVRIAFASLLAVYNHCKVRANFRVRRALYRWFCFGINKKTVGDWIRKNKYLIIYILREYTFFLISAIPSLDEYMNENYYWHHMKKNTYDAMDFVRKHVNNMFTIHAETHPLVQSFETGFDISIYDQFLAEECYFKERIDIIKTPLWFPKKSWFDAISGVPGLASFNKSNLDFCHRPIEASFLDAVLGTIKEIDDSKFNNAVHRKIAQEFPKEWEELIYSYVCEGYDISEPMDQKWLAAYLKVNLSSIFALEHAKTLYMRETSRSKIQLVLKELAEEEPRDYYILKLYFFAMEKRMSVIFYDLPEHITRKQIDSFFKMYDTLPGHALDENAGVYYYCPNCGELKAKVVPSDSRATSRRDKERECTIAFERISVNMLTGEKTCAKPASKAAPKKRSGGTDTVSEIMGVGADQRKESKKQSKDSRKRKVLEKCQHTKLVKFCFIGKIMRTEKWGLIIICPWCLCLTTLTREAYKNGGGELSCGCVRTKSPLELVIKNMLKCGICRETIEEKEGSGLYLVYDDVTNPETPTLKYVAFCQHHKTAPIAWIEKWDSVLRLSQLQQAVREGWKSIRLSSGNENERIFVRGTPRKYSPWAWRRHIF